MILLKKEGLRMFGFLLWFALVKYVILEIFRKAEKLLEKTSAMPHLSL